MRKLQAKHGLYLETFLAAVYPCGKGGEEQPEQPEQPEQAERVVVIVPLEDARLPKPVNQKRAELERHLPANCLVLGERELGAGSRRGSAESFGQVLSLWERLHRPFLAAADAETDPIKQIDAYRKVLQVDYACELAHQNLSDVAKRLARKKQSTAAKHR